MTLQAGEPTLLRPATVPVHDDPHVPRERALGHLRLELGDVPFDTRHEGAGTIAGMLRGASFGLGYLRARLVRPISHRAAGRPWRPWRRLSRGRLPQRDHRRPEDASTRDGPFGYAAAPARVRGAAAPGPPQHRARVGLRRRRRHFLAVDGVRGWHGAARVAGGGR